MRQFMTALILGALTALGATGLARAGDMSAYDVIGYSGDSRYFAFSEYGTQDGSGFSYATVFIVDLERDRFAGGPYRILVETESAGIADALDDALSDAAPRLSQLGIRHPARLVAADPPGETDNDRKELSFNPVANLLAGDATHTARISTFPLAGSADCESFGQTTGFRLDLSVNGTTRQIYRDTSIPKSRHCPLDYQLSSIWMPAGDGGVARAVAIISVVKVGFEGPDRRVIAVPVPL